jgi:hypothetical protein
MTRLAGRAEFVAAQRCATARNALRAEPPCGLLEEQEKRSGNGIQHALSPERRPRRRPVRALGGVIA